MSLNDKECEDTEQPHLEKDQDQAKSFDQTAKKVRLN